MSDEKLERGWHATCEHTSSVTFLHMHMTRPTRAYSWQALALDKPVPDFTKHCEAEPSRTVTFLIFTTLVTQVFSFDDVLVSDGGVFHPPHTGHLHFANSEKINAKLTRQSNLAPLLVAQTSLGPRAAVVMRTNSTHCVLRP